MQIETLMCFDVVESSIAAHGMIDYRFAAEGDLQLLAEWNHQLIEDEGHRNPMAVPELQERMKGWLAGEYQAVIFMFKTKPVAYVLYRESEQDIHLRQLYVAREKRRQGIGREAIQLLREQIWPRSKRLTVDVLMVNRVGLSFWRAVGYRDYCLTLEIMPQQ